MPRVSFDLRLPRGAWRARPDGTPHAQRYLTMNLEIFATCPQTCDGDGATYVRRVADVPRCGDAAGLYQS